MAMAGQSPLRQLFFYLRPYKAPLLLNIFSNIMMALCMVISIPIIIPFFQILFGRVKPSPEPVPFSINNIQDVYKRQHQANLRIIQAVADYLKFPMERVMVNIQKYGNTTSATIPLCLWEWEDQLKPGDKVILTSFGGGYTLSLIHI